jgi:uncharacterized repeat protein (TIGR01451 family)
MTTFKRLLLLIPFVLLLFVPASALAGSGPQWSVTAYSRPTSLAPGGTGVYRVTVTNTGGAPSDGSTITVADTLPAGLTLAGGVTVEGDELQRVSGSCTGLTCELSGSLVAGDEFLLSIPVVVKPGVREGAVETNLVTVSGGGAAAASDSTSTTISSEPAKFGVAPGSVLSVLSSTQAGAHADLTTSLAFNTIANPLGEPVIQGPNGPEHTGPVLAGSPRGQVDDLPPGFAGDLADTQTCPVSVFSNERGGEIGSQSPAVVGFECPLSTQVGTILLRTISEDGREAVTYLAPVFNLAPNPGEVAKLGFFTGAFGIQGEVFLRPGDDGIRTSFLNDPDNVYEFESFQLTVWGVPAEPANNALRGVYCHAEIGNCRGPGFPEEHPNLNNTASTSPEIPYLTNPTQCTGNPLQAELTVTSWEPGDEPVTEPANTGTLTGCDLLEFKPSITAAPDTTNADTPAGLTADVKVPQEGLTSAEGLSTADLQNTTVTLPAGIAINPGQAAGLEACQAGEEKIGLSEPASCPNASIVGHAEVRTPLLKEKLEGDVYVLQSNPPDVKLLVEIAQPIYGIYVKLIGDVHLNTSTGQLTTTFEGTPELPFSDFKLSFSGGAQAALSTPTGCGTYTTEAGFTPWTAPIEPEVLSNSEFAITAGTDGAPCPSSPLPFSPSLDAGATTDQAGGYTHFSLLLQSADDQQRISKLQFKVPAGLSGMLSTVPLCGEAQANAGTCSSASQIGHTVVASGPGPYPLVVPQPGQPPAAIYLTGPYEGAPFGLSIVVPVVVGPFVLQTQVVRASINVDPHTAQITVTTNPLPQIIDGVPTDLRTVNAVIDREGFMFNPTNCNPQEFSGTATSAQGTTAPISSHFQVGSCQSLKFAPDLKVATSGKTSKADGASLEAKIVYPTGALGDNQATSQANIAKVKVDLPRQLPSRLTTLQKACTAAQFNANPAGCPAASVIGHATALTPELPVPLTGPAYFVSNGGEAFPNLEIVLQGDNVTILLVADTFISKAGITSSTFNTVPDAPVTSFTLTLPEGKYSALAANGNLCTSKLAMPTSFTGQNGAEIHETTPISVSGCAKTKALTRAQKLTVAMKACKRKAKGKRAKCERAARKHYGPLKQSKKKGRK